MTGLGGTEAGERISDIAETFRYRSQYQGGDSGQANDILRRSREQASTEYSTISQVAARLEPGWPGTVGLWASTRL